MVQLIVAVTTTTTTIARKNIPPPLLPPLRSLLILSSAVTAAVATPFRRHFSSPTPRPLHYHRRYSAAALSMFRPDVPRPYRPPRWAEGKLTTVPAHGRLRLANLPTPIHRIVGSGGGGGGDGDDSILSRLDELDIRLYVKRDDATGGAELGGNKIRKLEFLLADAIARGCDSVVTIGGEQSNHCRATAAACRMVGLDPHLILRTRRADAIHGTKATANDDNDDDAVATLGWTGNVLFDRIVGSTVYTCTPGEYGRVGSNKLVEGVCDYLCRNGGDGDDRRPYPIPVGGSNGLGTWGYIQAVEELMDQLSAERDGNDVPSEPPSFDHVVFAAGSGGTATGIALGLALAHGVGPCDSDDASSTSSSSSGRRTLPKIHGVCVCDDPDYFYRTTAAIADEMGLTKSPSMDTEKFMRRIVAFHQGKGRGYALAADSELDFAVKFATETGISLDPVYTGKALHHFLNHVVEEDIESYRGSDVLFWHTGGALGIYDMGEEVSGRLEEVSPVKRIDVYGAKKGGADYDGVNVVPLS